MPDQIVVTIDSEPSFVSDLEEAGPPGASAYDIWLALPGNAGKSIAEFLASLSGPPGPPSAPSADAGNQITAGSDGGPFYSMTWSGTPAW